MKKYILMLAVAAATTLVACGNKEAQTEEAPEVDTLEAVCQEVEPVCDSTCTTTDSVTTVVTEVSEVVAE